MEQFLNIHAWSSPSLNSGQPIICPLLSHCFPFSLLCFLFYPLSTSATCFFWYLTNPPNSVSLYWPKMLCSHDYMLFFLKNCVCVSSWTYCRNFRKCRKTHINDSYSLLRACSLPGNVKSTSHVFIHLIVQEPDGTGTIIISILQVKILKHRKVK